MTPYCYYYYYYYYYYYSGMVTSTAFLTTLRTTDGCRCCVKLLK